MTADKFPMYPEDQTFKTILLAQPLLFRPLHLYLTTTVRQGMFYCCYASFLNILLEDIYYNGPENDLTSTTGDQNIREFRILHPKYFQQYQRRKPQVSLSLRPLLPSPLVSCQLLTMPQQPLRLQQFLRHLTSFRHPDDHSAGRTRQGSTLTSSGNAHAMSTQRYIQTVG